MGAHGSMRTKEPPIQAGGARCKQGKASGRRPAGVHTGERGSQGCVFRQQFPFTVPVLPTSSL